MAAEYKHNEYFRRRLAKTVAAETGEDSTVKYGLDIFTNVEDAKTKCGFHNTYLTTNSPTVTYALADSNKTLKVTFEFASGDDQDAWKTAVTNMSDSSTAWYNGDIEWFRAEWLAADGSVANAHDFDPWPDE